MILHVSSMNWRCFVSFWGGSQLFFRVRHTSPPPTLQHVAFCGRPPLRSPAFCTKRKTLWRIATWDTVFYIGRYLQCPLANIIWPFLILFDISNRLSVTYRWPLGQRLLPCLSNERGKKKHQKDAKTLPWPQPALENVSSDCFTFVSGLNTSFSSMTWLPDTVRRMKMAAQISLVQL